MTNTKYVTVPLKVEELKEFIENKNTFYLINYKDSQLRGSIFLNYISNLEIPCEVAFNETRYEEKEEFLIAYLTTKNIVKANGLRLCAAQVILHQRGIDTKKIFNNPVFSEEESNKFIKNNKEILDKWEQFLESSVIFAQFSCKELDKELNIKEQVRVVDDVNYLGYNVINLFSIPSLMTLFFSVKNRHEMVFFKSQFEDYMFKGRNLFEFFFCKENEIFLLFIGQVTGVVPTQLFHDAIGEARKLLSDQEASLR